MTDPRKHAIPPAPPEGAPERYDCPVGACKAPTIGDGAGWLSTCTYLPNDGVWLWTCGHGRPFYLSWQPAITTAEMMDALRLGADPKRD